MSEDPFLTHRSLLFTVAYEMLGSAVDAEDAVQETWLRWDAIGEERRGEVRDPRAYLVQIVTRQSLNRLRTLSRQREEYFGEWLPEPLLTGPDVAEDVELAENVSIAMLTVLETLGPAERAVFVLHDVFDVPYGEIAKALDKSQDAVRQIAHRARRHVAARRPRVEVSRDEQLEVAERLQAALDGGDLESLMEVLAPDVVLVADGGGLAPAALRPIAGAEKLIKLLAAAFARTEGRLRASVAWINGAPGVRVDIDGEASTAVSLTVEDGRITQVYAIRNPEKLERLERFAELGR